MHKSNTSDVEELQKAIAIVTKEKVNPQEPPSHLQQLQVDNHKIK